MNNPSPRIEAAVCGESKYAGNPCKRGHTGLRYVLSGDCVECRQIANRRHRQRYTQHIRDLLQLAADEAPWH